MGKNGGEPIDTVLTLEEALSRFKRKQGGVGEESKGEPPEVSSDDYAVVSATVQPEGKVTAAATSELTAIEVIANACVQHDEASAEMSASEDFVAVIDGVPRTLEQLEQLLMAEQAYEQDFPDDTTETVEPAGEVEDEPEIGDSELMALANRHALRRDYAFGAMGTALMVLFAFLITHGPIVSGPSVLLMAQNIPTPPSEKEASSPSLKDTADLMATMVIIPDTGTETASAPQVKTDQLEAHIKDTLKSRAFPDIGVSVSKGGDAYLAGEVYSLNEVSEIAHIVHSVNGVNRVHFLHPDVLPANGPAYFGATTASAPAVWGAKVKSVVIGSPADKAGLKPGDVISEFDGKTIPDGRALNTTVMQYSPGQRVQFRVWHNGQPEYLIARLGEATTVASR
jgi:PDZ domain/BON domain